MANAIETEALVKRFGGKPAVDGIDLAVARGSVFGLLGPNGAGKTTTIRMLATLIRPDGGAARVLGHDVVADAKLVRSKVSLTGQYASVDEDLTGRENLVLIGRLLGMSWRDARGRADELLATFGLDDAATQLVRTYSGGMRRRIDIATSLVVPTEIMFLDEPTTGLDPRSRNQVWEMVRDVAARGTTVLLTTQYLEEADRLADRLAVIDHGRLIAEGTSRELKRRVGGSSLRVRVSDPAQRGDAERVLAASLADVHAAEDALVARVDRDEQVSQALAAFTAAGIGISEFSLAQPSLDEVFFALTGKPATDDAEDAA